MARSLQKGNSRFYLHLSALDASVDAPLPSASNLPRSSSSSSRRSLLQESLRKNDDNPALTSASPSSMTPSATPSTFGASSSHGNFHGSAPERCDGEPLQKSASSAALIAHGKMSSRTMVGEDAPVPEEAKQSMARSKPVDVPVFHLNGPEGEKGKHQKTL